MRLLLALAFALLPIWEAVSQEPEIVPQQVGEVTAVDVRTPEFAPVETTETTFWQHQFSFSGSETLRLHFSAVSIPADSKVQLIVQDRNGVIIDAIGGGVDAVQLADFWSLQVPGDYALVALVGSQAPSGVVVTIDGVAHSSDPAVSMSIIGPNELQEIVAYAGDPQISLLARSIARLSFIRGGKSYVCTGFMVGPDRLMTNEHCVNTAEVCASTVATFDYQRRADGSLQPGTPVRCAELVTHDKELDVALLRLTHKVDKEFGVLQLIPDALVKDEPLFIVQHPGGRPKMISRINCTANAPITAGYGPDTDVAHTCDTEGGTSGSPVLNSAGQVVALHHFGVGSGPMWDQNRAVRMSLILKLAGLELK